MFFNYNKNIKICLNQKIKIKIYKKRINNQKINIKKHLVKI